MRKMIFMDCKYMDLSSYFLCLLFAFILSCSDSNKAESTNSTFNTGSYTCTLVFPGDNGINSISIRGTTQIDCTTENIENVVFTFYNSSDEIVHGPKSFDCDAHSAIIGGIPVGNNYYVIVNCVDPSGIVVRQGRDDDVDIVENQIDDGGEIEVIQQCVDRDSDGYYVELISGADCGSTLDCNDSDDSIYQDCPTATWYRDLDNDGYGNPNDPVESNSQPTGYVSNNTDCDDNDADEHPGQTWYKDADGDGYSESTTDLDSCERPANYFIASELVASSGDCNDDDENINPGVIEICDDTNDNDCDGYVDCSDTDCDCPPPDKLLHERIGQFSWYDDNSNCACLPA